MAIIAFMLGGIFGFISLLTAILVFDASLLTGIAIYMASGCFTATLIIAGAMIPVSSHEPEGQTA